jgi:ubiquinone/menaquinone biosynthesis C-methylase UbiE
MPTHDTKQSEKDYLRRTASGEWERYKPFSPPGSNTIGDSTSVIQDFAVAIANLPPRPTDRILDVGAGACWCSDWLQRLNCQTVAIDIAHDMLRLGRTRLPRPDATQLVAGDLEDLPFASGTFDKAYCLSAIHHVPDIGRAVAEICRVLKPTGAVIFSEPGVGHADMPGSISAMRDFGVLEQDVVPSDFARTCLAAGFTDVQLKPMSYVLPEFGLSPEDWDRFQALARSKRPSRAIEKIWRGMLELFGLGKKTVLFEEAFAIRLVRLLVRPILDHPVIVARKGDESRSVDRFLARVELLSAPENAAPGSQLLMTVRIVNTGQTAWPSDQRLGTGFVRLGVQLLDQEQRLINRDLHREPLPHPVAPGGECELRFVCPVPIDPGVHHLKLDMVIEGVAWLESRGAVIAIHPLHIG